MSALLRNLAKTIIQNCAVAYGMPPDSREMVDAQMFCLGEEAGEALGAWRRLSGRARRNGTREAYGEELADVVVAAYSAAYAAGINLDEEIHKKALVITTRGWKEPMVTRGNSGDAVMDGPGQPGGG